MIKQRMPQIDARYLLTHALAGMSKSTGVQFRDKYLTFMMEYGGSSYIKSDVGPLQTHGMDRVANSFNNAFREFGWAQTLKPTYISKTNKLYGTMTKAAKTLFVDVNLIKHAREVWKTVGTVNDMACTFGIYADVLAYRNAPRRDINTENFYNNATRPSERVYQEVQRAILYMVTASSIGGL